MRRIWIAALLVLTAARCGGIAKTNVGDLCSPDQQIECDCAGHAKGVRTCSAGGIGYGECACPGGIADGGAIDDGISPALCTSKSAWKDGLRASEEMTPGRPCIECHSMTPRAPQYTVAGTIFPGRHDPDDCNGVDGMAIAVAFMDDSGKELFARLQLNRVGNFFAARALPASYRVKVISEGRESVMQTPVTNGDCNFCHTAAGAFGASGRMTKP